MPFEIVQIIEDEPAHAGLLDHALRKARYRTNVAPDGEAGIHDAKRLSPALILLDAMLPGMDGHEVCRRLKKDPQTTGIPIIMISAVGTIAANRVAALHLGVDDYIAKPFSPQEVIARVEAVLRRSASKDTGRAHYLRGQLILEDSFYVVSFRGKRVQFTWQEWRFFRVLAEKAEVVVTREELTKLLWGKDGLIHEHELYRLIRSLNQKLDEGGDWGAIIATSAGYALKLLPL